MKTISLRNRKISRRTIALIAITSTFGIGSVSTLAAWTFTEYRSAALSITPEMILESSTDGTTWTTNTSATGGALTYTTGYDNLAPGDVVYSAIAVREKAGQPGLTTSLKVQNTGSITGLTMEVIQTSSLGCTKTTTGTTVVAAGTALGTTGNLGSVTVGKSTVAAAGTAAYVCIKITAGPTLVEGTSVQNIFSFKSDWTNFI